MASGDEDIDANPASSERHKTTASSCLAEKNVRIHTAKTRPKDKKERHLKHDDCCRYCERYCDDKITEIKRREIEAWRHDVPETMDRNVPKNARRKARPRLKFMRREPPGLPDSEPGFRRIRTPKELRKTATNVVGGSEKKNRKRHGVAAAVAAERIALKMMDLSLDDPGNVAANETGLEPEERRFVETIESPVVMNRTFSRDSLDTSSTSELDRSSEPQSQHSNRSCSNELLNVITIDDVIKHHRDQLIRSNDIRLLDTNQKRARNIFPPKSGHRASGAVGPSSGEPDREINVVSTSQEFRLHPHSARHSRPISKSSIAQTESTALDIGKLASSVSCRSLMNRPDPEYGQDADGQHRSVNIIMRAVDEIVGDRCVYGEKVTGRAHDSVRDYRKVMTKPESRRFRKMNRRLRELIQEDYMFDSRMAARLRNYNQHRDYFGSEPYRGGARARNVGYQSTMTMSSKTPISGQSYNRYNSHSAASNVRHLERNSNSGQFLEMLTDYRDPEIPVI
ncbi:hypothetical protein LSH36_120g15031 [Paralvinella palmiformis]|uniref:Uncharacterized protein n=1 Tax=Paralvinella palmiformis TaxID=53620 RepID=A0AAD9JXI2_9ANNE|nr:hypothetical protein LSH36_120g15031 [Paralvinella palmiformis]